jgi:hypothetical protein
LRVLRTIWEALGLPAAALANFFNTTPTGTGANGGLLTHANLPQNFFVVNRH